MTKASVFQSHRSLQSSHLTGGICKGVSPFLNEFRKHAPETRFASAASCEKRLRGISVGLLVSVTASKC